MIVLLDILRSVFLGVIQGLTEFLPVSSSAHLNIFPWVFKWEITESFDLALHIGTLFAILVHFFKDWVNMVSGGIKLVVKRKKTIEGKLFWYLVIASIPAGILALVFEKAVDFAVGDNMNLEMIIISVALIVMGVVLYIVDKKAHAEVQIEDVSFKQAMIIGVSQSLAAAVPGVSRSGITMTAARALKLDRESAARFSFLLSAPIVAAATLVSLGDFEFNLSFLFGVLSSFISGLLVIRFLLDFLKKGSYKVFAVYRIVIGVIIIGIAVFRM